MKEQFICSKQFENILEGWAWYGEEPYVHGIVYKSGEECDACKEAKKKGTVKSPSS